MIEFSVSTITNKSNILIFRSVPRKVFRSALRNLHGLGRLSSTKISSSQNLVTYDKLVSNQ